VTEVKILSEITTFISRGITPKYTDEKKTSVINQKCIRDGQVNLTLTRFHDHDSKRVPQKKILRVKDILVNSTGVGTLGRVSQVILDDADTTCDSHVTIVRPDALKINPDYLGAFMFVNETVIETFGHGSTGQTELSRHTLGELEVPIRDTGEQRFIGQLFQELNQKIQLNQKMNQTLEEIAKAIFKSWFVDFDPVRAKTEGRPTGLPPEISDLFPDELVDSEIGEIPNGWKVTPLSECAIQIESGRRPKGGIDKSLRHGIPSVGAESIAPAGEFDFSKVKYVTTEFAEKMEKGRVQNFDVALYKDGGKPGQFIPRVGIYGDGFPFEHFYVNEHVFLLRSEQLGQPFLYRLVSSRAFLDQLIAKGSAKAAQPGLNQTEVVESTFVRPRQSAIAAFNDKTRPLLERQFLLGKENEVLSELRDTLLPRLISGELRIPDAEKFLEKAGI